MSLASLLDRSLTLERPSVAADGSGGALRSFSAVVIAIPCAISPARASVVTDYARRDMVVDYHVYTTADLDTLAGGVRLGDRFVDGSTYYLVKGAKKSANAVITAEVLYQIDCERRG